MTRTAAGMPLPLAHRTTAIAAALAAAIVLFVAILGAPPASATNPDTRQPVPETWQWWAGGLDRFLEAESFPPGANDDSCRPTARHPRPVILLHGTGGTAGDMASHAAVLHNKGICVFAPTYGVGIGALGYDFAGGFTSIEHSAGPEIAREIDRVKAVTGARQVDLVGVSQGGIVASYVTKVHRPADVHTVVGIATFFGMGSPLEIDGSLGDFVQGSSQLNPIPAMREFTPGSTMHRKWMGPEGTPFVPGVRYFAVTTETDGLVPSNLSDLPGTPLEHISVQDGCPQNRSSHLTQVTDPRFVDTVASALDPSDTRPARCVPTDGLVGPLVPVPPR